MIYKYFPQNLTSVLFALFFVVTTSAFSQDKSTSSNPPTIRAFESGNWSFGSSLNLVGLNTQRYEGEGAIFGTALNFSASHFVAKRFAIGVGLATQYSKVFFDNSSTTSKSFSASAGVFGTYYLHQFFIQGGYAYQILDRQFDRVDFSVLSLDLGRAFFFNEHWAFTPSVGYSYVISNQEGFGNVHNFALNLGIKYFLFSKK